MAKHTDRNPESHQHHDHLTPDEEHRLAVKALEDDRGARARRDAARAAPESDARGELHRGGPLPNQKR